MSYKIYITMKNNLLMHFQNDNVFLRKKEYSINIKGKKHKCTLDYFKGFSILNIKNIINLIIYDTNCKIPIFEDFIDVTGNKLFNIKNILNNSIVFANAILEGTDGVGKTTLTKILAKDGIIIYDRDVEQITKKMKPHITSNERNVCIKEFLEEDPSRKLIILFLSDTDELLNRISSREVITDLDKDALIFQEYYLETFNTFKDYANIFAIDCSHKEIFDVIKEIKTILNIKK